MDLFTLINLGFLVGRWKKWETKEEDTTEQHDDRVKEGSCDGEEEEFWGPERLQEERVIGQATTRGCGAFALRNDWEQRRRRCGKVGDHSQVEERSAAAPAQPESGSASRGSPCEVATGETVC